MGKFRNAGRIRPNPRSGGRTHAFGRSGKEPCLLWRCLWGESHFEEEGTSTKDGFDGGYRLSLEDNVCTAMQDCVVPGE